MAKRKRADVPQPLHRATKLWRELLGRAAVEFRWRINSGPSPGQLIKLALDFRDILNPGKDRPISAPASEFFMALILLVPSLFMVLRVFTPRFRRVLARLFGGWLENRLFAADLHFYANSAPTLCESAPRLV